MQFVISNFDELDDFAHLLSRNLKSGDTILLDGHLGSGKTEFVRRVARHLGVTEEITSPTFCFLNTYKTKRDFNLYHFDVYRLNSAEDLDEIGFDDFGYNPCGGVSFIEWADKFLDEMPSNALSLKFSGQGDEPRLIEFFAKEGRGVELLRLLDR